MKKILLFIIIFFVISFQNVYANSNYNTSYFYSYDESLVDYNQFIDDSNHTLSDLISSFVFNDSEYYNIYLSLKYYRSDEPLSLDVILIPKSKTYIESSYFGVNYSNRNSFFTFASETINYVSFTINFNDSNYLNNSSYLNAINCLNNGGCTLSDSYISNPLYLYNSTNAISTNSDVSVPLSTYELTLPFYSNVPLIFSENVNSNVYGNGTPLFKTLNINDTSYTLGERLPTYYDIFGSPLPQFNDYNKTLEDIYIGSIPKSSLSSFHIDLSFNVFDENYASNIYFNSVFYGRVNHSNNYYSYEKIECNNVLFSSAYSDYSIQMRLFDSGVTCTSDLSSFDNIYIKIQTISRFPFNDTIFNLNISSSYGNIITLPTSIGSYEGITIYEKFENLSSNFSLMLSTLQDSIGYHIISDNQFLNTIFLSKEDNKPLSNYFSNKFGTLYNSNLIIKNNINAWTGLSNLDLFISEDTILSFSDNDTYYYYDDNNTISSDTITDFDLEPYDDSYDVSYYFGLVSGYIDSLSDNMLELHDVIQQGYNLIPEPFSTLILVLFILACVSFILLLIRRD